MKNFLKILTALILVTVTTVFFTACDKTNDDVDQVTGTFKYTLEEDDNGDKYYVITGYEVSDKDADAISENDYSKIKDEFRNITIPSTGADLGLNDTYPVKELGSACFANQKILKSVTIGANIETIGEGAFAGCVNLESLTVPFIGKSADAKNDEKVFGYLFGSSATDTENGNLQVTAKIYSLTDEYGKLLDENEKDVTFYVPSSLKKVTITAGEEISRCAFYGFSNLTEVIFPDTVKTIGNNAFQNCSSLTKIDLTNVETVYSYAFAGCSNLRTVEFGGANAKLKQLHAGAFSGCSGINRVVYSSEIEFVLPSTVEYIGVQCFNGCVTLTSVDLSATQITEVARGAFLNCYNLKTVILPDDITVKAGAFKGCSALEKDDVQGNVNFEQGSFDDEIQYYN